MKLKKLLVASLLACSSLFALSSCNNNNSTIQYGTKYIRNNDFFAENKNDDDCEYIIIYKNHKAIWHDSYYSETNEYYWDFLNSNQILIMKTNNNAAYKFNYSKSFLAYGDVTLGDITFIAENYKVK